MRMKRSIILFLFAFLFVSPIISFSLRSLKADTLTSKEDSTVADTGSMHESTGATALVETMTIDGPIGTVVSDRIKSAVEKCVKDDAALLVIYMDTPGGFTESTWDIIKTILNSQVPVCVYIAPSGSRAASAGVYITYAANFAAMAPSTNIGAAHPVGAQGEKIDSIMNEKITNDAVAQIKATAQRRGRNIEWAEKAVRQSVSIPDQEALKLHVVDFVAPDLDSLIALINGRETETPNGNRTMHLSKYRVEPIKESFIRRFLEVVTNPNIAFILMSIGGLGVLLELYNPGAILPGVVGAICLILAFYAFQTLPINYAGVALIVLAAILFIAEIKVVSHGILTIGGLISLFFGGVMLIDTADPSMEISKSVLLTVVLCVGAAVGLASYLVIKAAKRRPFIGNEGLVGKIGHVKDDGFVYVEGALWKALSDERLEKDDAVEVLSVDGLTLKVKKITS